MTIITLCIIIILDFPYCYHTLTPPHMKYIKIIWQIFFCWKVKPSVTTAKLDEIDVVLTHAAALRNDGRPGPINEHLADVIELILKQKRVPIFAQGELAFTLRLRGIEVTDQTFTQQEIQQKRKQYLDTWGVSLWHKEMCEKHKLSKAILISYEPHLWRALMTSLRLGLDVSTVVIGKPIYDSMSSQKWMRAWWRNSPREVVARMRDLFLGHF